MSFGVREPPLSREAGPRYDRTVDLPSVPKRFAAAIAACAVLFAVPAGGEELRCEAEQPLADGGRYLATLKLATRGGIVTRIVFDGLENYTASGNPLAVFACGLDTADPGLAGRVRWSREGGVALVEIADDDGAGERSALRVVPRGGGWEVVFVTTTAALSGNSSFPARVEIGRGEPRCTLTLAPTKR